VRKFIEGIGADPCGKLVEAVAIKPREDVRLRVLRRWFQGGNATLILRRLRPAVAAVLAEAHRNIERRRIEKP
jgi:hypothetical protein